MDFFIFIIHILPLIPFYYFNYIYILSDLAIFSLVFLHY
ncbi:hypothetical protein XIS1_1790010 [Xenorhabdus innexi]|uniref:Uncharacterized protein n=1 Tax=Xenorhabdus innexi TaxID=290109 RepID=A0A1N6MWQ8_9GAMM|nr:hypothetical protein XIS1_1790010 [Xenorhabdus innexi]